MVTLDDVKGSLLQGGSGDAATQTPSGPPERTPSSYAPLHTFALEKDRPYQQQYGDIYFLRLTKLKPAVEQIAAEAWDGTVIGGEPARRVERVLDVRQGELCWVAGTVYMDMPLKPNVMDDVSKDRWISAPANTKHYFSEEGADSITLEDDSGRIKLVGDVLHSVLLVTGCIIAVMGTENANGDLEVIDLKFPDLAPQPDRWTLAKPPSSTNGTNSAPKATKTAKVKAEDEDVDMADGQSSARSGRSKIAIVSGLEFSGVDTSYTMELNLLLEYLLGEALDPSTQAELAHISRLIIAGNSIAADHTKPGLTSAAADADGDVHDGERKLHHNKKYGYDASSYNPLPSQLLDTFLAELLPSMPMTLLPGATDPANASFPQQPVHNAMFPRARAYTPVPGSAEPGWFDGVTNPWEGEVDGWRVLGSGGQNVDDIFRYVDSDDRLGMMEAMCRWRCSAPTAPDTLWTYPFQEDEPFVMKTCPHIYFAGCQPEFGTKTISGPDGQTVRLIAVPSFAASREIVLVDSETLEVSRVKITT